MLVGVDLVDIGRMREVCLRTPRFPRRVFTELEREYAWAKGDPYPSLAACFATREAFRKLHREFTRGLSFEDVYLYHDETGCPMVGLQPAARNKADLLGIKHFTISISHTDEIAIAVIIGFS